MAATAHKSFREEEAPLEKVPGADLKSRLIDHLSTQRHPGEILKVTQVGPRNFRVNWLVPTTLSSEAMVMRTYRLAKSQFLLVEDLNGSLVVTDRTR